MNVCSNCGQPVENGKELCPNCGASVSSIWPPPPVGSVKMERVGLSPQEVQRKVNDGATTGCIFEIALWFIVGLNWFGHAMSVRPRLLDWTAPPAAAITYGLPVAVVGLCYLLTRPFRPYFARGLGYSLLAGFVLFLGALVVCRAR